MSIKCEMTLTEEEATDSVSEYETDSELESSEGEDMASPYSSKPLPELSEAEISAARELREWLAEISDPKTRVIQTLFLADSDNDAHNDNNDVIKHDEFDECEKEVLKVIGERNVHGRLNGECEVFYKNGDYFWGHFVDGIKHGKYCLRLPTSQIPTCFSFLFFLLNSTCLTFL